MSQSLWNRAGSFDFIKKWKLKQKHCLNPFGTGQGLSTEVEELIEYGMIVSIPLEQGRVFRLQTLSLKETGKSSLNPFGTGQGLSTGNFYDIPQTEVGLNPFGTGQGLSTSVDDMKNKVSELSQSLWNRAGSFDLV